jgi:hypothetical protein
MPVKEGIIEPKVSFRLKRFYDVKRALEICAAMWVRCYLKVMYNEKEGGSAR